MKMYPLAFTTVAFLLAAGTARADALSDFEQGSRAVVTVAIVEPDGTAQTVSATHVTEKRSGSVDFAIPAADLGLDLPITLHLRGTPGKERGRVDFEIDESWSEPIQLDREHALSRVTGHLSMRAYSLPGTVTPEVGGMYLAIAGESRVVATGDWGELSIPVTKLVVQGGLLQPPLDAFVDSGRGFICSDRVATQHTFEVSLAGEARGDGALVQFRDELGAGVLFPAGVYVPPGRSSATIDARVQPDFVGRVRLSAAAGGVERTLDVEVHPASDCAR